MDQITHDLATALELMTQAQRLARQPLDPIDRHTGTLADGTRVNRRVFAAEAEYRAALAMSAYINALTDAAPHQGA